MLLLLPPLTPNDPHPDSWPYHGYTLHDLGKPKMEAEMEHTSNSRFLVNPKSISWASSFVTFVHQCFSKRHSTWYIFSNKTTVGYPNCIQRIDLTMLSARPSKTVLKVSNGNVECSIHDAPGHRLSSSQICPAWCLALNSLKKPATIATENVGTRSGLGLVLKTATTVCLKGVFQNLKMPFPQRGHWRDPHRLSTTWSWTPVALGDPSYSWVLCRKWKCLLHRMLIGLAKPCFRNCSVAANLC